MVKITNSNPDGSAIRTNADGSGPLTRAERKHIGFASLRTTEKVTGVFAVFATAINAFKQWRQSERDIDAFEHGNHERMIKFYLGLGNTPNDEEAKKIFASRIGKLIATILPSILTDASDFYSPNREASSAFWATLRNNPSTAKFVSEAQGSNSPKSSKK